MTKEMEKRFSVSNMPFDWKVFYLNEEIKLSDLREILLIICKLLEIEQYPDLNICSDWWEHDGFISNSKKIKASEYRSYFDSSMSLWKASDKDHAVRIGLYPDDFSWYLRFNIDEEYSGIPDQELGDFDLTLSSKYDESNIVNKLKENNLTEDESIAYFKRRFDKA